MKWLITILVIAALGGGGFAGWRFLAERQANDPARPAQALKDLRLGQDINDIQFEIGKRLPHTKVGDFLVYQHPVGAAADGAAAEAPEPPQPAEAPRTAAADAEPASSPGGKGTVASKGTAAKSDAPGKSAAPAKGDPGAGSDSGAKPDGEAASPTGNSSLRLFTNEDAVVGISYGCAASGDDTALDRIQCGQPLAEILRTYHGLELIQFCNPADVLSRYVDLPRQGKSFLLVRNKVVELWIRRAGQAAQFPHEDGWHTCAKARKG